MPSGGRAIRELVEGLAAEPGAARVLELIGAAAGRAPEVLAVGWATVELDRAAAELAGAFGLRGAAFRDSAPDEVLGARARVGAGIVLLESLWEGRLAGALARRGEGPCALYIADRADGAARPGSAALALGPERPGPLGPARLVSLVPARPPGGGPLILLVRVPSPPR